VSPNLGIGFSSDLIPLTLGVGGSYFIANGFALGLSLNDTILIYTSSFKSRFPDVQNQIPTNSVYLTPTARYVFYRNHRFSPYVFGGLGPVFFNHGGGTRGFWQAGPAALIGIGGPIYLNIGVAFSGVFPTSKCLESFEYTPPDAPTARVQFDVGCGFRWGPIIGIAIAPRGPSKPRRDRNRRKRDPEPDPVDDEPPRNPLGVPPADDPPSAGAAGTRPGLAPGDRDLAPDDAPADEPGPAAPPGDLPVSPPPADLPADSPEATPVDPDPAEAPEGPAGDAPPDFPPPADPPA
jgi:hypothetical protein